MPMAESASPGARICLMTMMDGLGWRDDIHASAKESGQVMDYCILVLHDDSVIHRITCNH